MREGKQCRVKEGRKKNEHQAQLSDQTGKTPTPCRPLTPQEQGYQIRCQHCTLKISSFIIFWRKDKLYGLNKVYHST